MGERMKQVVAVLDAVKSLVEMEDIARGCMMCRIVADRHPGDHCKMHRGDFLHRLEVLHREYSKPTLLGFPIVEVDLRKELGDPGEIRLG